jgi:DNA-binding SARP family transcriptional activator
VARPSARRPGNILDVIAAVLAALLAFTAVPAVLILVVGNPLSGGLGHAWRPVPLDALCVLALVAWVAWAACCAQLVRAVVAHVRQGDVDARRSTSVMDRIAARIAIGVLALTTIGAPLALSSGAGASAPSTSAGHGTGVDSRRHTTASIPPLVPSTDATYAVQPGDTLWSIADNRLADGADWTALAAVNLGREMGGGTRFVDPDDIRAGWRLYLTDDAAGAQRGGSRAVPAPHRELPDHLPELVALGLGSLACAALARRTSRRRRPALFPGDLDLGGALSEGAVDAAALVNRFAGVPALHSFEAANCLLGWSLRDRSTSPAVRAICVAPSGVTFWFALPQADPPDGFVTVRGGAGWRADHGALDGREPFSPYLPIVLPVGDDDEGTWLVPLGPGDVLPLLGESAPSLWRSARTAVGSWAWSDTILMTEDPDDPGLRSEVAADPLVARSLLYFGDPGSLPPGAAGRTAVVTLAPVAASDLTILVDRRGATLHPMGRVVRPHLQTSESARRVEELLVPRRSSNPKTPRVTVAKGTPAPGSGIAPLAPGTVDVRLLTMTPRLEGLREDLPPNRARRAVELVAYLTLHQPDVITSDRLRTRVLGSSDADAASKTLFNTAYAARRAMGVDEHGDPLFPTGSRNGLYQVSPRVTVDVGRAIALAGEGKAQADPDLAIAYFREALQLVEGEPLANALSGYSWWEAEGHGGRITAVLVDAACAMATLASDAGLFELARWGLDQARVVEPYSETLSRAAMEVAAAEGDADRLRIEWRECQRRVDVLDPGSSPSSRTESLYGELSRRVLVGASRPDATAPRDAPAASD